jgi:hypothetical protein
MRTILAPLLLSLMAAIAPAQLLAAEVDARPPDRLTLSGNGSELTDTEDQGGGGSLNWLHYFTPDALMGLGAEHQFIEESSWTFGSLRGAYSRGQPGSRFTVFGEAHYGDGDDDGREFDYSVAVLGISQGFTTNFSVQLETRQIDIDRTHGNLPKIGFTYVWTPRLLTNVSYADSVGGNLGTELTSVRIDYYGRLANLLIGGAFGQADPIVLNSPGLDFPAQDFTEGFIGLGKTFARGEVQLIGDYLKLDASEKVTVTLSFTVFVGSRGRTQ